MNQTTTLQCVYFQLWRCNMTINPEEYGKLRDGSSIKIPVGGDKIGDILKKISTEKLDMGSIFSRGTDINYQEDQEMINDIETWYSRALDSVGLNFKDPIQAYGKYFNKNMQTLGLDPQRAGNSYVYFTRPDLNFSQNISGGVTKEGLFNPFFEHILKSEIGNFVGEYLQYPNSAHSVIKLDNKYKTVSPFDPLKSNLCKEVSGVKDIVLDSFETNADFRGHQLSYATGADGYDTIGEVTVTFEDTTLSPIFLSTYIWILYIHEVARGDYWPKYKYIAERIIDYTCSIYLFKLAEDNQTILRWAKLTGCYPISIPLNTLNHSRELKHDEFDEVTVTYKYNFYEPMDPRVFQDFNKLVFPSIFGEGGAKTLIDRLQTSNPGVIDIGSGISLTDPEFPERLLEATFGSPDSDGTINGRDENRVRPESLWSKSPFIVGNKLHFL